MALFGTRQQQTWPPSWSHTVDGMLWLLKISRSGRIILEARHPERKVAAWSCLDERNGTPLWTDLSFKEPWWMGIEDVTDDRVFFHGYRKPDMPQHQGIIAVDIETGRIVWEHHESTFLFAHPSGVYVSREGFEALRFSQLDAADGHLLRDLGQDSAPINILRAELNEEDLFAEYAYPTPFDESHPAYPAFSSTVFAHVDRAKVRGTLDVLARAPFVIASWHELTGHNGDLQPQLDQKLVAFDAATGAIAFAATLNRDVPMPTIDSFFVKENQLLYISNTQTLTAHRFPPTGIA